MMTAQKNTLVFLPWLQLSQPLSIRDVHFTPYSIDAPSKIFDEFKTQILKILESYCDIQGKPITDCVLVYLDETKPCKKLSNKEASLVHEVVQLLAFCVFSKNEYFRELGQYANYSMFESYYQCFHHNSEWVTPSFRRRDGETIDGGYKHGEVLFSIPLQCSTKTKPFVADISLIQALNHSDELGGEQTRRILQAISLFNQAHPDSNTVLPEREVILLASAFEQLFAKCQGANDLACKLGTHLDNYGSIEVVKSRRDANFKFTEDKDKQQRKKEEQWFLHRKWIQEFYQLRNDFTHGNDINRRTWGWSMHEHLVMASFVFPLLVKILLTQNSKEQLSEDDLGRLYAVDLLLDQGDWGENDKNENCLSNWQSTIRNKQMECSFDQASEEACKRLENEGK